jgi:hypothetical protein
LWQVHDLAGSLHCIIVSPCSVNIHHGNLDLPRVTVGCIRQSLIVGGRDAALTEKNKSIIIQGIGLPCHFNGLMQGIITWRKRRAQQNCNPMILDEQLRLGQSAWCDDLNKTLDSLFD